MKWMNVWKEKLNRKNDHLQRPGWSNTSEDIPKAHSENEFMLQTKL